MAFIIYSALVDAALGVSRAAARLSFRAVRSGVGLATRKQAVDRIEWAYLQGGAADGDPLVLLHGFGGSKDNWLFYAPLLASRYRVICPDLPGFGDSTRDAGNDYGIDAQVERLAAFLVSLGIDRCHLGGNSLGGYITLAFALKYPERVASLALFNNAGVSGAEQSAVQREMEAGENPLRLRTVDDVDRVLSLVFHQPPCVPLPIKYLALSEYRRRGALLDLIFEQVIKDAVERPRDHGLGDVRTPTIIFWGREDRLLHVSAALFQHEHIAESELVVLDAVGHLPMIERPRIVAAHHRAFLARTDQASSAAARPTAARTGGPPN